jgi:hypothetical protein
MVKPAAKKRGEAVEKVEQQEAQLPTGVLVRLLLSAWLIPGGGHFIQGKRHRALVLSGSILSMFLLGLLMQGEFYRFGSPSLLHRLGFLGEWAVGVAMPAAHFFGYSGGDPYFASADYGTAFLVTAGMLNILAMFDAYDIAMGRKK